MALDKAIEVFTRAGTENPDKMAQILFEAADLVELREVLKNRGLRDSSPDQFFSGRLKNLFSVDEKARAEFIRLAREKFGEEYELRVPLKIIDFYVSQGCGVDTGILTGLQQDLGKLPAIERGCQAALFRKLDDFLYSQLRDYLFPEKEIEN